MGDENKLLKQISKSLPISSTFFTSILYLLIQPFLPKTYAIVCWFGLKKAKLCKIKKFKNQIEKKNYCSNPKWFIR